MFLQTSALCLITQDSALACAKALWSEQGKLNEWGTQEWYSCICKEVWLDQGQLNSQSTGDCAPHMHMQWRCTNGSQMVGTDRQLH
jgi:hypothetical protein